MLACETTDMDAPSTKDRIVETIRKLPDDATVEDAIERLLFLAKVERGLRQADEGPTMAHDEMKRRFST